jgi:transposase
MGGVGTAHPAAPARCEAEAQPRGDQRHRPCFASWVPLARLSGGVWSTHHPLQSVQSLVGGGHLAENAGSVGEDRSVRIAEYRQHHLQGTSLCCWRKRGAQKQAIGRSRGGRTTKIHAVADTSGRLIAFDLTPGQMGDVRSAKGLIDPLPSAARVLADTAYDSDKFRNFLIKRATTPVIKPNPNPQEYSAVRHGRLQGTQRDRTGLLAPEGLAPCRNALRQTGEEFPRHCHPRHHLQMVDLIESGA